MRTCATSGTRLISSHVFQPTSPAQSSPVPGRKVKRNGLRKPCATIRRRFGSLLAIAGLPAAAAPVSGLTRRIAPSSEAVWAAGRRKVWARSAPPCAVGGVSVGARRIAARVDRAAVLAVVGPVERRAVARADVEHAVGAEVERADRVARILLAPVLDQHGLGAGRVEPRERGR